MMMILTEHRDRGRDHDLTCMLPLFSRCHGRDRGRGPSETPHLDAKDEVLINGWFVPKCLQHQNDKMHLTSIC